MSQIPTLALDEIIVRFLLNATKYDFEHPERFYFILEEAHWFYIDFFQNYKDYPKLNFQTFKNILLEYVQINNFIDEYLNSSCISNINNSIIKENNRGIIINNLENSDFNVDEKNDKNIDFNNNENIEKWKKQFTRIDYTKDYTYFFTKYKHSIPVYGGLIFNQSMDSILLVKGYLKSSQYVFPRGKKDFNESGINCAIREIYEEIGLDVSEKIINYTIKVSNTITLFLILNIDMNINLKTKTRNEIKSIKWISIENILNGNKNDLERVGGVYKDKIDNKIQGIKKLRIDFDISKIEKAFSRVLDDLNGGFNW
ncbi:mRNA decapping complex subunit 2 [Dictyocoela muelleri]|nr:mRNA decapping complex subunit 2 [Dictyocoela muelleri]